MEGEIAQDHQRRRYSVQDLLLRTVYMEAGNPGVIVL